MKDWCAQGGSTGKTEGEGTLGLPPTEASEEPGAEERIRGRGGWEWRSTQLHTASTHDVLTYHCPFFVPL